MTNQSFQNDVASSDVIFEALSIFSSRMLEAVDVRDFSPGLQIFEHLDKPYLTGTLVIADTSRIYDRMDFQGAEYLEVKLKRSPSSPTYVKMFNITEVTNTRKTNDQSEVITLQIVEDLAYKAKLHNVNKHYYGKPSKIIESIAKEYLYKSLITSEEADYQGDMNVIIPNLNPIETMVWLKERVTNIEGFPYFLYSTIGKRELFFINLADMLSAPAINKKTPFVYSQAPTSVEDKNKFFNIQDYKHHKSENMLNLISKGLVGGVHNFYNTMDAKYEEVTFDIIKELNEAVSTKNSNQKTMNIADDFEIDGDKLHNYRSRYIYRLSSSGAYSILEGSTKSYDEEHNVGDHKKKVIKAALKQLLARSTIEIRVSGKEFLAADGSMPEHYTIGNSIRVQFMGNGPNQEKPFLDPKKSGDYVIFAANHSMSAERYDITFLCVKIANINNAEIIGE